MNIHSLRFLKISVVSIVVLESLLLAYLMRPIQDDYYNLQSVQEKGVFGYLLDVWNFHGGNMVQFFIHCITILPTTQNFVFWNLSLFFVFTQVLVFLTIRFLSSWLFKSPSAWTRFWIPLLTLVGFEGLFVPGFLGAFGFSLASLAHLWPVMALVIGLLGLRRFNGSWLFALLLGLIAGNSNLGESALGCGVWLFTLLGFRFVPNFAERSGIRIDSNFYLLGVGVFVGTAGIAAAPGFWNRASGQVGLPGSLTEFLFRFAESFASFTADGLSHPMVWVLFLLGVLLARSESCIKSNLNSFRFNLLVIATSMIWFSLIMGSTFAYPAWHQSMGMYVFLLPLAFALGIKVNLRISQEKVTALLAISGCVMLFAFLRVGVLSVERSVQWDKNLAMNACRIIDNPSGPLLGAEIQYPPFGLGVDDVNTWEWLRTKYVGWVVNIPDQRCLKN